MCRWLRATNYFFFSQCGRGPSFCQLFYTAWFFYNFVISFLSLAQTSLILNPALDHCLKWFCNLYSLLLFQESPTKIIKSLLISIVQQADTCANELCSLLGNTLKPLLPFLRGLGKALLHILERRTNLKAFLRGSHIYFFLQGSRSLELIQTVKKPCRITRQSGSGTSTFTFKKTGKSKGSELKSCKTANVSFLS